MYGFVVEYPLENGGLDYRLEGVLSVEQLRPHVKLQVAIRIAA